VKTWVNGDLLDAESATLSVFDHGLTVGDGVFETAKVVRGFPFALSRHLARLNGSARGLGLPETDPDHVRQAVLDTLAANAGEAALADGARLRITYTGGTAPLGSDRGSAAPSLVVAVAPMHPWAPSAAVAVVPWPRNERSAIAGLKTTSYAENVVALAYAKAHGATEAILANTVGNLCEGTGSNVFLAIDGRLVTPPLSSGCLAGVTRALLLEWVGADEVDVPMSALYSADEVFITSSTRDVQPVHAVDSTPYAAPGPLTTKAQQVFADRSVTEVDP
jgi:branched-chain amino acid aminotransferase